MKLIQIIPLLIFVGIVSYLVGGHIFDREIARDKAINRIRLNEHSGKPHKELLRLTSPDGRVDAILAEIEADPSNSNIPKGYAIYLVRAGGQLDLLSPYPDHKVFYANRIKGLEIVWREPTLDTYSHVLPSMQKNATEQLEQMLYQKTGTQ